MRRGRTARIPVVKKIEENVTRSKTACTTAMGTSSTVVHSTMRSYSPGTRSESVTHSALHSATSHDAVGEVPEGTAKGDAPDEDPSTPTVMAGVTRTGPSFNGEL